MEGPRGDLAIQTLAMPADTNPNGDIFGGWLLSQMDLAGGIIAKRYAHQRIATVAINGIVFQKPVKVGDIVSCYGEIFKVGRTSMHIRIEAWRTPPDGKAPQAVTQGEFIYVAIDANGNPSPVVQA